MQPVGNETEPATTGNDPAGSNGPEDQNLSAWEKRQIQRKEKLKQAALALADRVIKAADDYEKEKQEIREEEKKAAEEAEKDKQKKKRSPKQLYPNALAHVYRMAAGNRGTQEDSSKLDLWVKDPLTPAFEPMRRFLWLTRRPSSNDGPADEVSEKEAEMYMHGAHQPVDTYMNSLRQLSSTAERAHLIAATRFGRAGYVSSPRLVMPVISEFILHRFYWNFMRRRRTRDKTIDRNVTRAQKLGLNVPKPLTVKDAPYIRRKVFDWAEELTRDFTGGKPTKLAKDKIAEKITQRVKEKITGKITDNFTHDIITADLAANIVKKLTTSLTPVSIDEVTRKMKGRNASDKPDDTIETIAEDIAENVVSGAAAEITQIVTTWLGTSTKH